MKQLTWKFVVLVFFALILGGCKPISPDSISTVTPTIMLTPFSGQFIVIADLVPIRTQPNILSEQMNTLVKDEIVSIDATIVDAQNNRWYRLEDGNSWLAGSFIKELDNTAPPHTPESTLIPIETRIATGTIIATQTVTSQPLETRTATPRPLMNPTHLGTSQPSAMFGICSSPTSWIIYTIRGGDTLPAIAVRTRTTVEEIMEANCLTSILIEAGDILYLPKLPSTLIPIDIPTGIPIPMQTMTSTLIPIDTPTRTPEPLPSTPTPIPTPMPTTTPLIMPIDTPTRIPEPLPSTPPSP